MAYNDQLKIFKRDILGMDITNSDIVKDFRMEYVYDAQQVGMETITVEITYFKIKNRKKSRRGYEDINING